MREFHMSPLSDAGERSRGPLRFAVIAAALGISRQSAWQYYAPRILNEFEREENCPPGRPGSEADDLAVSETRAVRRRRRSNSA